MTHPAEIHLVGSVPLPSTDAVFETICSAIGPYLKRIPDGETGERSGWISFQRTMLTAHHAVMVNPAGRTFPTRDIEGNIRRINELFVLDPEIPLPEIDFLPLGYTEAALQSWQIFQDQQARGVVPADLRFQVSVPTPFATALLYFHPDAHEVYINLMKRALLHEVAEICAAIPHDRLAIQWDCCQEILQLEGYFPGDWVYDGAYMAATVATLGDAIPSKVELGYHFCYGSPVDAPLVQQKDMGVIVDFCNLIAERLSRRLDFVHLPVSQPDADADFFQPLERLNLAPETEPYLGILHPKVPGGDSTRIKLAQRFLPSFGVATECGWGRKSQESIDAILDVHLAAVLADGSNTDYESITTQNER